MEDSRMAQPERNQSDRFDLYLIAAGVVWGAVDMLAGGLLAPLSLPSKSIFLVPLGILVMSVARARTGLAGSCALMGVGAALLRTAVGVGGRCPTGFLCSPVALLLQGVTLEGTIRLLRAQIRGPWMSWTGAGALAGGVSPLLFAAVAVAFMGWTGGWSAVAAYAAPRVPLCLVGGALASALGVRLGALLRVPVPAEETGYSA
jgi:hypothetical protein